MSFKKWVTMGTLALTALASEGCVKYAKRSDQPDYSELRRIESQPDYLRSLYAPKCPETTPPQYCRPKR